MSVSRLLLHFGLKQVFDLGTKELFAWVDDRFGDSSRKLPRAVLAANQRAWHVVGLALSEQTFGGRLRDAVRDGDLKAARDQIRAVVGTTPGLDLARAAAELDSLRSAVGPAPDLDADVLRRFADPAALADDALQAVRDLPAAVAAAPHLAAVLRLAPDGTPLFEALYRHFFRAVVAKDADLSRRLTLDRLGTLDARTAGVLDQLDILFDDLGTWFAAADRKHDEILGKIDQLLAAGQVTTNTRDPLRVSVTNERELAQLRQWRDELRKLPPDLVTSADWSKLGDVLAAGRLYAEAGEAHRAAARAAADRGAEAEAEFKAYRSACEREGWADALAALVRAADLDPGRFAPFPLKDFVPDRILGSGGFGTVVLCRERLKKNRAVAVKAFHAADLGRELDEVFAEAHAVSELSDPGVIRVFDWRFADAAETRPYLVMEFFDGVSLAAHLRAHGRLAVADFVPVALRTARAMAAAHAAGVLHRDLKPGNVLVRRLGEPGVSAPGGWDVRVIDFGLAVRMAAVQASVSTSVPHRTRREQSFAGTLEYASPEQKGLIGAAVGPRSDVYSYGKTMLEGLLGTTEPTTRAWKTVPDGYRDALQDLLERCVEKPPADRHDGFGPVVAALEALDPAGRKPAEPDASGRGWFAMGAGMARAAATGAARVGPEQGCQGQPEPEKGAHDPVVGHEPTTNLKNRRPRWLVAPFGREPAREAQRHWAAYYGVPTKRTVVLGGTPTGLVGRLFGGRPVPAELELSFIPPGTFHMGSETGELNEKPVHHVTLTQGFFMSVYPVTQAQWNAVMGPGTAESYFTGDDRPVDHVAWGRCRAFCESLTAKLDNQGVVRLPTEAEWEYACRAGTTTDYYTGDGTRCLTKAGWYKGNSGGATRPVGQLAPNAWGLYDMHGNVWEWVVDWEAGYPPGHVEDPVGPATGTFRVLRGGSWAYSAKRCRSAERNWFEPTEESCRGNVRSDDPKDPNNDIGFRVVLTLPGD